jgi:hypothetical protein
MFRIASTTLALAAAALAFGCATTTPTEYVPGKPVTKTAKIDTLHVDPIIDSRIVEATLPFDTIQTRWTIVIPRDHEITLELRKGSVLRGTVVDPEGRPLASATVYADHEEGRFWGRIDDEGRFRIAGPPQSIYRLTAHYQEGSPPDARTLQATVDDVLDTGEDIRIVLLP